MSDKFVQPGKKLESLFRDLREERDRALERRYREPVDCISFARLMRITQGDVTATAEEAEHIDGCRRCKRTMKLAQPYLPVLPPLRLASTAMDNSFWKQWGVPIMVEAFAIRASTKNPALSELKPGVYPFRISERPTGARHAQIELRPAGKIVRLRHVEGEPVLIKATGEALGPEYKDLQARPGQSVDRFLEDVLVLARPNAKQKEKDLA